MWEVLVFAVGIVGFLMIGAGLGYWIGFLLHKGNYNQSEWNELNSQKITLETKYSELQYKYSELLQKWEILEKSNRELEKNYISMESEYKNSLATMDMAKKDWEETKKNLSAEFYNIANKVILENSERFSQNSIVSLEAYLKPFKDNLSQFSQKMELTRESQIRDSAELRTEIQNLSQMNKMMSDEARNLTRALKGESKVRGQWGEVLLEKILETSGLEKGIHFRTQESLMDIDRNLKRPDIIIDLPENKNLVIDSKVSLLAYENYCNTEDPTNRSKFLQEHIRSLEKHAKELSDKNYIRPRNCSLLISF